MTSLKMFPPGDLPSTALPDYSKYSFCDTPASSFYLALPMALFESLVRLSKRPDVAEPVWQRLGAQLQVAAQVLEKHSSLKHLEAVQSLIAHLRGAEPISTRLQWISGFFESNDSNICTACTKVFRGLLCQFLDEVHHPSAFDPSLQHGEWQMDFVEKFCESLEVSAMLWKYGGETKDICNHPNRPILHLLFESNYGFGVLYHVDHLVHPDQFPDSRFPFAREPPRSNPPPLVPPPLVPPPLNAQPEAPPALGPCIQPPNPPASTGKRDFNLPESIITQNETFNPEAVMKIANSFALYCIHPEDNVGELVKSIEYIYEDYPEYYSDDLKRVHDKLKECPHLESPQFTPKCGQSHCKLCLLAAIEKAAASKTNSRCPCKKEISKKIEDEIKGTFVGIPEPAKPPGGPIGILPGQAPRGQWVPILPREEEKVAPPDDPTQQLCDFCGENKEREAFESLTCPDCFICSYCRVLGAEKNRSQCPSCGRQYSDNDMEMLGILVESVPRQSSSGTPQDSMLFHCVQCKHRKNLRTKAHCPAGCNVCSYCLRKSGGACQNCNGPRGDEILCTICLTPVSPDNLIERSCGHPIHAACADKPCSRC